MTRVLILGSFGPIYLTVARSCRRQNIELYLLDVSREQGAHRKCASLLNNAIHFSPDLIGTQKGIDVLAEHVKRIDATALIASSDKPLVWLAEHRHVFEPSCKVLVQSPESLRSLLSKCNQLEIAAKVGFSVLPTFLLMCPEDAAQVPTTAFPLALRPSREVDVQPCFKVQLIKSQEHLRNFLQGFQFVHSPIIAQSFMSLPNLVVHGVRSTDGQVLASRAFLVPRKFEGVSLALESYSFPECLEKMCIDFVARANITGCYHFEFLFSPADKRAYFLEVNVRMGGTTDKVMQFGFDEPALLLQAYGITSSTPLCTGTKRRRVVNKRALLKHILWSAKGKLTELDYPDVSGLRHIFYSCRDLLLAKDSIFDCRDFDGSLRFHLRK